MDFNFEKTALDAIDNMIETAWDYLRSEYGFMVSDTNDVLSEFDLNPFYTDLDSRIYEEELKEPWLNIRNFDGIGSSDIDPENADLLPYTNDEQGANNFLADYLPMDVVKQYVENWLIQRLSDVRDPVLDELVQEFLETPPYDQLDSSTIQKAIDLELTVNLINAIADETYFAEIASKDGLDDLVE